MSERTLYVGYNLSNDITQVSVYRPEYAGVEAMGTTPNNPDGIWESSIVLPGIENPIRNFVADLQSGKELEADGKPIDRIKALAHYFRKTLSITRHAYPGEMIRQLVVTVEEPGKAFTDCIYQALETLGIGQDRARVISHRHSFLYYVLSQEKSLWMNDVGMFEFNNKTLIYRQMNLNRRNSPALVGVASRDYTEYMKKALAEEDTGEEEVFEGIVRHAIHRQILSALYITGNRFGCEWVKEILQNLCTGRRVFMGNNLYVSGAAYAAREFGGESRLRDYVFLDDDMIRVGVSIKVYADAREREICLVRAGTPWYQAKCELAVIPDDEDEIAIRFQNILRRDVETMIIPLEGLRGRTDRLVRLHLSVRFANVSTCILTIKDRGFGTIMPSSNRIWEKIIALGNGGKTLP